MESWLTYDSSVCMGRQAHPATQFHSNVTLLPNLHMGPNSGRQQKPKLAGQTSGQHVLARLHTVSKQRRNSHLTQALPTAQHSLPSPGTEFLNNQQEAPTGQVTADLVPINKYSSTAQQAFSTFLSEVKKPHSQQGQSRAPGVLQQECAFCLPGSAACLNLSCERALDAGFSSKKQES